MLPAVGLMIRGGDLGKSMSRYLIDELASRPQIALMTFTEVVELKGEPSLEAVVVADARTGERRELECKALFVFIGADPHTDWLRGHVAMDETASCSPAARFRASTSRTTAMSARSSWRRAGEESSRSATSTRARSSALPRRSGKARWPSGSSTSG